MIKATDLLSDPKAWLYFLATSLGALAASQTLDWRSICASLSAGLLSVKAYTSKSGLASPDPISSDVPPSSPPPPQPSSS